MVKGVSAGTLRPLSFLLGFAVGEGTVLARPLTPALSRREREQTTLLGSGFFVLLGGVR